MKRIRIVPKEGLKQERSFRLSVQLSRLINAIQANTRHFSRIQNTQQPANLRDQIELILYHGAIVYEAVKTVSSLGGELHHLSAWSSHSEQVKRIQTEANDNSSFTQKYLKQIRNEVIFHFDPRVVEIALNDFEVDEDTSFGESESEYDGDLAFVLADELLLHYIMAPITERDTVRGKWEYFQEALLQVSNDLVELLLLATVELATSFTKIE